ncbi:hypothetical protein CVT26_002448 [Gymnopilus dilepis]|uniref:Nephrocystin 3-like N-terminal domain-containing protein n=1 Tax=Gymnopilus dilepis TaxID=231916 RepID=A0A409YX51_9AGAR|nr:hypothetical protein CVT26_002448 [Gymnopilus dilepis]
MPPFIQHFNDAIIKTGHGGDGGQNGSSGGDVGSNNNNKWIQSITLVQQYHPSISEGPTNVIEKSEWISKIDFRPIQTQNYSKHTPQTGEWFLATPEFSTWLSNTHGVLWAKGIPGAGKTILMSITIHHLRKMPCPPEGKNAVVFAYIQDNDKYLPHDLLASLSRQLVEQCSSLPKDADDFIRSKRRSHKCMPPEDSLELFQMLSKSFNKVYVVLDALDEMSSDARGKVLKILLNLHVNLLITSRHIELNTRVSKRNFQTLTMDGRTGHDIETFIGQSIEDNSGLKSVFRGDKHLIKETCSRLREKAGGMFLAASLHVDALQGCMTRNAVRERIEALPSDLKGMWRDTLKRIEGKAELASVVKRAVIWLAYAQRSLVVEELENALGISTESMTFDPDDVTPVPLLIDECCGLLVIDDPGNVVRFAHRSALEFFRGNDSGLPAAPHSFVANSCIAYLSAAQFPESLWEDHIFQKWPLLGYAHHFWGFHAHSSQSEETGLPESVSKFVLRCSQYPLQRNRPWEFAEACDVAAYYGLLEPLQQVSATWIHSIPKFVELVHLASERGHRNILDYLLTGKDGTPNAVSIDPLAQLAVMPGPCLRNTRDLRFHFAQQCIQPQAQLDKALAYVLEMGQNSMTYQIFSCKRNDLKIGALSLEQLEKNYHEPVVQILISSKGDNLAVLKASMGGYFQIAQFLLSSSEIDLDSREVIGAIESDYNKIALEVLKKARDLSSVGASAVGMEEIMNRLISTHTSNIDSLTPGPLSITSDNGRIVLEVVHVLQNMGIDTRQCINPEVTHLLLSCRDFFCTSVGVAALITASQRRRSGKVVDLLISQIDLKAVGHQAIISAYLLGNGKLVSSLLSHPQIDLSKHGALMLQKACLDGHIHHVQSLLSRDDVNPNGVERLTINAHSWDEFCFCDNAIKISRTKELWDIHWEIGDKYGYVDDFFDDMSSGDEDSTGGSSSGDEDSMGGSSSSSSGDTDDTDDSLSAAESTVVVARSGTNLRTTSTALITACEKGNYSVVALLLRNQRIDVNLNINGYTALLAACKQGHTSVVDILLSSPGIKIGGACLILAIENGHKAIVESLLAFPNFDVNAEYGDRTALITACRYGRKSIVQKLLDHQGVKVNAKSDDFTALIAASRRGHQSIVELLLSRSDIDVNARSRNNSNTPLIAASEGGHEAIIRQLMKCDKFDIRKQGVARALVGPSKAGLLKIVQPLLRAAQDIDLNASRNGRIALVEASREGHVSIVQLLLSHCPNVDVNVQDIEGETALIAACRNNQEEVVRILLSQPGIKVDTKDKFGESAVTRAYKCKLFKDKALIRILTAESRPSVQAAVQKTILVTRKWLSSLSASRVWLLILFLMLSYYLHPALIGLASFCNGVFHHSIRWIFSIKKGGD